MVKWIKDNGNKIKQLEKGDKIRTIGLTATIIVTDEQFDYIHRTFRSCYIALKNELEDIRLHELILIPEDLKEL